MERVVRRFETGVVEAPEPIGPDDFFDFEGETFADEGDREGFFFGGDFGGFFAEGGDDFAVGYCAPVVVGLVVIGGHFLKNFDGSRVGVFAPCLTVVALHAAEVVLP